MTIQVYMAKSKNVYYTIGTNEEIVFPFSYLNDGNEGHYGVIESEKFEVLVTASSRRPNVKVDAKFRNANVKRRLNT